MFVFFYVKLISEEIFKKSRNLSANSLRKYRPVCYKSFEKTIKLYWLLLIEINNDLNSIRDNYKVKF